MEARNQSITHASLLGRSCTHVGIRQQGPLLKIFFKRKLHEIIAVYALSFLFLLLLLLFFFLPYLAISYHYPQLWQQFQCWFVSML